MESEPEHLLREIDSLRQVPPPSREALAAGRRRFLNEAADLRRRRARRGYALGLRRILGPIAAALLLLLGTLAGAIAAAQGARPDSPLYPVKLAWESARLTLAAGPQERAELALALTETRVEEMAALVQAGRPIPIACLEKLQSHLELALVNAAQLPDAAMRHVLRRVEEQLCAQERTMEQALGDAGGPNRETVRLAVESMIQTRKWAALGQSDPEAFRQAGSTGFALVPPPAPPTGTATPWAPTPTPSRPPASPTPPAPPTGTAEPERPPTPGTPGSSQPPTPSPTMEPGHTPQPTSTPRPTSPKNTPGRPPNTPGPTDNTPGPSVRPGETQGHGADATKTPRH